MPELIFNVPTLPSCPCKVKKFKTNLSTHLGDKIILSVSAEKKTVKVEGELLRPALIKQFIQDQGYEVREVAGDSSEARSFLIRGIVCAAFGVPLLGLSIAAVPFSFPVMIGIATVSTLTCLLAGSEIYLEGLKALFLKGSITIDLLFTVSTLTAVGISVASFFVPMFHFEFAMALLILGCRHLGKFVESLVRSKVVVTPDLCAELPQTANAVIGKTVAQKAVSECKPGETVRVFQGETIPFDGEAVTSGAQVCREISNGQKLPEVIKQNQPLLAGMTVEEGVVDLVVQKFQRECYLKQLQRLLDQSREKSVPLEATTDRLLSYFVPGVLAITAIATGIAVPYFGVSFALHVALALLAGACPCALGYTVPLAIKAGINRSSELGLLVNNPQVLQVAAEVETVVFDLNGTLTQGKPQVTDFTLEDKSKDQSEVLSLMASLQGAVENRNAIGSALLQYTRSEKEGSAVEAKVEITSGGAQSGFSAAINGETYHVGNISLMDDLQIEIKDPQANRIYLAKENKLIASFDYEDPLRDDAKSIIQQLVALKKRVVICTGADPETALTYAKQLEVDEDNVIAGVVGAEAKLNKIQSRFELEKTAFIGDGVNDILVLNKSAVGVAVQGAGRSVAGKAAIELTQNSLSPLTQLFAVSARVNSVIKQNLAFTLLYNVSAAFICIGLTTAIGMAAPAAMALCMTIQSLLILANTTRICYAGSLFAEGDEPKHEQCAGLKLV